MDAEPGLGTAYLDALAVVLLEIASLPLVTSVKLSGEPGDKPTNIKVRANVKAEFVALPKSRQPSVCLSQERPTQLEAARGLLEKLRSSDKGGYAQELAAAAAAAAEAPADAGSSSSPSHAPSAFDRLKAASVAHRALKQAVADAERAAREACDAERAATAAREEAEAAAAEAKAALAAFEPRTAAQRDAEAKRQKTRHPREARPYDTYLDVQEWRRQETLQWDRRRVALTDKPARRAEDLKPRGPTGVDGPLNHWRRSVAGAVLDWAEGSRADAAKIVMWTIEHLELEVSLLAPPPIFGPPSSHPARPAHRTTSARSSTRRRCAKRRPTPSSSIELKPRSTSTRHARRRSSGASTSPALPTWPRPAWPLATRRA